MTNLLSDARYALRQFRLSPAFTLTAVCTLALGIGGTTAIFSLIHAVMLRSLPVSDPASLYRIGDGNDCCVEAGPQTSWGMYSFPLFEQLKAATPEFEQLAAFQASPMRFSVRRATTETVPRPLRGELVTGNYFSVFGIQPFAGRLFSASDDLASSAPVAVLSYRIWQQNYGGRSEVLGSTFNIEGHPFTIAGIAPPGFFGETLRSDPPDIWMPLQQEPVINGPGSLLREPVSAWLRAIGRLKPGATTSGMSPRLTTLLRHWIENDSQYPAEWMPEMRKLLSKQSITVVSAGAGVAEMKEGYSRSLHILLTVCSLVLLIACANIANLLLARGMARSTQTSVRLAIGASAVNLIRQSLVESVLLGFGGGAAGLLVAYGASRLLLALAFHGSEFLPIDPSPSLPVLFFAFVLSLVTGVLFGVAPALFAIHTNPVEALRGSNRSTRSTSSLSRKALLVVQATLAVVLVAGATMLTRSLGNLEHQDFGFQTKHRLAVSLNSPPASYSFERLSAVYRDLEERLNRLPQVEKSGFAMYNPLTDNWGELIYAEGHPAAKISKESVSSWDRVSTGYLDAIGQPIMRGRGFRGTDHFGSVPVAVVNQAFVKRFLPGEDPLNKRFGIDLPENAGSYQIVGVVRDAKYTDPERPVRPMFFVPLAQRLEYKNDILTKIESRSHLIGGVVIVTRSEAGVMEPILKKTFAQADPNFTIINVRSMQDLVNLNFDQQRAVASLAGLFGTVALLLAAVGLYGVTAYAVAQRRNEIGVRMALGANRVGVVRLVLQGAFHHVLLGLLLGIPLAIGAGRLIASQLYQTAIWDPLALLLAIGSLTTCGLLAAILPASRAASIQPMTALRSE